MVSLEEMKNYLRVDSDEDDDLITALILSATKFCMNIARVDTEEELETIEFARVAVMFSVAYFYEHREDADHHKLSLTLRAMFQSERGVMF